MASFDRSIDVLVSRLRRKLGDTRRFDLLKTLRNGGYQFAARVDSGRGASSSHTINSRIPQ